MPPPPELAVSEFGAEDQTIVYGAILPIPKRTARLVLVRRSPRPLVGTDERIRLFAPWARPTAGKMIVYALAGALFLISPRGRGGWILR
jgi:hypothetical protein